MKLVLRPVELVLLFLLLFDIDLSCDEVFCEPVYERTSVTLLFTLTFERDERGL